MVMTNNERREYVEAFHKSGLKRDVFCAKHNLNSKTFYVWLKRYASIREEIKVDDSLKASFLGAPTFFPIQIAEENKAECALSKKAIALSFTTKNFCLEFSLNLQGDFAEFKNIVQVLHELV